MVKTLFHPLAPLVLFSVALAALLSTYVVVGIAPSEAFALVAGLCWWILVGLWLVADARRRSAIPCFDFGFFCYLFLPVVVPWYCLSSRGRRGILLLATIAGLWLAPYLVAGVVWAALHG